MIQSGCDVKHLRKKWKNCPESIQLTKNLPKRMRKSAQKAKMNFMIRWSRWQKLPTKPVKITLMSYKKPRMR